MSLSLWFILLVALAAVLAGLLCCVRHRHAPSPENALPSEGLRLNRHPLHYAVFKNDFNTVNRLLGEGASPRQTMADGQTPLHVAAECGLAAMCKFLLKNSAEVDALDNFGGSPLHAAAACQSGVAVIRILVEKGADIHLKDAAGMTPLALSKKYKHARIAAYLKSLGAGQ
ncbi:ankyrin repeat domain-containing protein [Candidatus Avelusimicrobium alvi]|uniref:ankyrin repeat domain-containing protein n=1 Tax=Candidatus Avelusimicrobium alvi TaxID=3416221 RepID=UPI003D1163B7